MRREVRNGGKRVYKWEEEKEREDKAEGRVEKMRGREIKVREEKESKELKRLVYWKKKRERREWRESEGSGD